MIKCYINYYKGEALKQILLFYCTFFLASLLSAQESMENLLQQYKEENKLSKITKRETAGLLELYTRDELEKMQAHNLLDVFKTIPGLILTKDSLGINSFKKHKMNDIPDAAARLYINDHDMTSASFGSAFLIWSDMPIEYVDHIEVYKATSSIEFGNEVASLVIKVYTKSAQREEGGKIKLMASDNGGYDTNLYYGQALENGLSYFVYGNKDNLKNGDYKHSYNGNNYTIDDSKKSYTLFANLLYKEWTLDIGFYNKETGAYTGPGLYKTPSGGGVQSKHFYAHLTKEFANEFRLQFAYDHVENDGRYIDENGMLISDPDSPTQGVWFSNDSHIVFKDNIYSLILDKKFYFQKHTLLVGTFYKYKQFEDDAFIRANQNYTLPLDEYTKKVYAKNSLALSSLYLEDNYKYDDSLHFVFSVKGDFYRYDKEVKSQNKYIARIAAIKNIDVFQIKAYATRSYIPATFVQLYNDSDIPVKVNPDLEYPTLDIYSASLRYKKERHILEGLVTYSSVKNSIVYDATFGYQNSSEQTRVTSWELLYKYIYNADNKLYLNYASSINSIDLDEAPGYSIGVRLFNKYKKLDIYNELTIRGSYTYAGVEEGRSYDYTAALKYHLSQDISIGVRGDNIFNSGYKQLYKGYNEAIAITPQRFWLNFEALF